MKAPEKDSKDVLRQVKQVGILTAIPFILLLGPLIGFFAGQWIDRKFGSSPYGMIVLIILGFAGSAKETVRMLKDALREADE